MKTAPPSWLPETGADPEALIKEARRRQRRRRTAVGLVIVVMLAGAVTASVIGTGGHSPGRRSPHRAPAVSGAFGRSVQPRFFADAVTTSEGNGSLEVRASASGTLVAQEGASVFGLAATGTDTFVVALQVGDGCATRLYRIRLSGRGRPGGLSPVGPELPGPAGRRPMLTVAEIDITTRAVMTLTVQLPGSAGMDPPAGMNAAW